MLFACNQGSTLFADGNTSNAIVTYDFWIEDGPKQPRHFRLDNTLKMLFSAPLQFMKKSKGTVC